MTFTITATQRQGGDPESYRAKAMIPGVVYGRTYPATPVAIPTLLMEKLYREAGGSSLIDLSLDEGAPLKVVIQDVQYDPVKGSILHVDFRHLKLDEEMETSIVLHFVGESLAVKSLGGTFIGVMQEINIQCLPQDLIPSLNIDINVLKTFDDMIHVRDLRFGDKIKVLDALDSVVAKVQAPLTEDQLKAMEAQEPQSVADVAVEEKGKKEEEGAEEAEVVEGHGEKKKEDKK